MSEITPSPTSPLYLLSNQRFGGRTTVTEQVVTVGTARVTLLQNNPNRLFWAVINEGGNDVRLSTDATITATSGWLLLNNGGVILSSWEDDGESVGYPVYAIAGIAGISVRVKEVTRL